MKLNTKDRLLLLGLLPNQGSLTTIRIVHTLRQELSFSEEEHKVLNLQEDNGLVRWDTTSTSGVKDVEIGDKATDIIADALKQLDKSEQITADHLPLYEKFVEPKE